MSTTKDMVYLSLIGLFLVITLIKTVSNIRCGSYVNEIQPLKFITAFFNYLTLKGHSYFD